MSRVSPQNKIQADPLGVLYRSAAPLLQSYFGQGQLTRCSWFVRSRQSGLE